MFRQYLIFCVTLILLASCSTEQTPVLRIGTNIWPGYEPLYMAREKQYLQDSKVRLVEYSSASQVTNAFRNDLIDAATLTLDDAFILLDSGEKFSIFLVMDMSHGGDALVAQSNIDSMQKLKGKKLGVENTALGAYMTARALELAKIDYYEVNITPLPIDEHEQAFFKKSVDAVITFDPVLSKLINSGGNILFDSKQIPGEIVDVLIIKDQYLNKYPHVLAHLRTAWFKTLAEIQTKPEASANILRKRMNLSIQQTLAAYEGLLLPSEEGNNRLLGHDKPPILLSTTKRLANLMQTKGLISNNVAPETLFSFYKGRHRD